MTSRRSDSAQRAQKKRAGGSGLSGMLLPELKSLAGQLGIPAPPACARPT